MDTFYLDGYIFKSNDVISNLDKLYDKYKNNEKFIIHVKHLNIITYFYFFKDNDVYYLKDNCCIIKFVNSSKIILFAYDNMFDVYDKFEFIIFLIKKLGGKNIIINNNSYIDVLELYNKDYVLIPHYNSDCINSNNMLENFNKSILIIKKIEKRYISNIKKIYNKLLTFIKNNDTKNIKFYTYDTSIVDVNYIDIINTLHSIYSKNNLIENLLNEKGICYIEFGGVKYLTEYDYKHIHDYIKQLTNSILVTYYIYYT